MMYKIGLVEAGEVFADDTDVINWIMCGLDHKIWGGVHDLIMHTPGASSDIAVLLPLLTNKEAALAISTERFANPNFNKDDKTEKKKSQYGMFGGVSNRGRGSYSSRGRGRGTQPGRGVKKCFNCGSTEHLIAACTEPRNPAFQPPPPPPPSASRGGSQSNRGGRGGNSNRGGHMHHARAPSPPPKRTRFEDAPAHPPSALKWRE